ncbi:MAG: fatty acid desaturase [Candidatus Parcubacteria bacterium]|nr:fatty acid desaturase [Burkholderiales bacterium]
MLFHGLLDLPWWGLVLIALGLTHITIASVTIYLHRNQAHRALDLHPAVAHFFRLWLWLTTGMVTKEWTAIHRKHHAKCETAEDPHSPQVHGINKVLWTGVMLYVKESHYPETMQRYGHGTPDDWVERNVYARHSVLGLWLMGAVNIALFGLIPGTIILIAQIAWIPFWAAGVINGVGHFWGYRNWDVPSPDASRNISPWGMLIGGEELHNNHHAYPASAKFSLKWYEFDLGWTYIRALESLGLATVKKVAPTPRFSDPKPVCDEQTLEAVIANRYDVLARYATSVKRTYLQEIQRLGSQEAEALKPAKRYFKRLQRLTEAERARLAEVVKNSKALATVIAMRDELAALWMRSSATREQLLKQLQDWCHKAESSGVTPLVEFSHRLRSYA